MFGRRWRPRTGEASGTRSVVVENNFGTVNTGDTVVLPDAAAVPPAQVRAPAAVSFGPRHHRGDHFVGREEALAWLGGHERRRETEHQRGEEYQRADGHSYGGDGGRDAAPERVRVVCGMGGVGKSALVAEYTHRHRSTYTPVCWISASSPEVIAGELAAFAVGVHPILESVAFGTRLEWAKGWLRSHAGWLLVLDNVERPQDVEPLVRELGDGGRVVVTTRRSTGWHRLGRTLTLDVLPEETAVRLLTDVSGSDCDTEDGRRLASELGQLPLALEQAAAYLHEQSKDAAEFLRLLRESSSEGLAASAHAGGPEHTVARVWEHSLHAVRQQNPQALHLLRVLAWFSEHTVPRDLLAGLREDPTQPPRGGWTRPLRWTFPRTRRRALGSIQPLRERGATALPKLTTREIDDALGLLRSYSLISLSQRSVHIHPLVQAVNRASERGNSYRAPRAVGAAADEAEELLLAASLTGDAVAGWGEWAAVFPHIQALLRRADPAGDRPQTAGLLHHAARYLVHEREHFAEAVAYAERAQAAERRYLVLGRFHPTYRTTRQLLGTAHIRAGAIERGMEILESNQSATGALHLDAGHRAQELAFAQLYHGDEQQAVRRFERILAARMRHGNELDADTLSARNNLAGACQEAGDPHRAVALFEQNHFLTRQALGPLHFDTLLARHNLANCYRELGDAARAVDLHRQNLSDREETLGPRHAQVFISRRDFALTLADTGETERAVSMLRGCLADAQQQWDPGHSEVLACQAELARLLVTAGEPDAARATHQECLTRMRQAWRAEHARVLNARLEFAHAWLEHRSREAVELFRECLRGAEETLGVEHSLTLLARNGLGVAHLRSGDIQRALPLFEENLPLQRVVFGERHSNTLTGRHNVANAYRESGDVERAVPLLEEILFDAQEAFGHEDGHAVRVRYALGRAYEAAGDTERALALRRSTLAMAERVFPPQHVMIEQVRTDLESAVQRAGQYQLP